MVLRKGGLGGGGGAMGEGWGLKGKGGWGWNERLKGDTYRLQFFLGNIPVIPHVK